MAAKILEVSRSMCKKDRDSPSGYPGPLGFGSGETTILEAKGVVVTAADWQPQP
jgi:hypothetical protein